jgi:lantibiotic modifying enzyme
MNDYKLIHTIDRIESQIDKLIHQTIKPGLLDGKCGIAIFYLYLWLYTKNNRFKKKAIEVLEDAIDNINLDTINFSLSSGLIGIAWTVEHFKNNRLIDWGGADVLDDLESTCLKVALNLIENENFDYLHGGLGYGIYCLEKPSSKERCIILSQIAKVVIGKSVVTNIGRTWEAKFNKRIRNSVEFNLGVSHGIPAIIYFLAKVQTTTNDEKIVCESVKWLKNMFYKENTISKVPERIINGIKSPVTSKLAWCYGDLGVSTALLNTKSCKIIDTDFLNVALNTINRIHYDDLYNMEIGICHGVSGLAFMYNKLYLLTNISDFKFAADLCYKFIVENMNHDNSDASLLEGMSGVGLSCLSVLFNENTSWDKILLLS